MWISLIMWAFTFFITFINIIGIVISIYVIDTGVIYTNTEQIWFGIILLLINSGCLLVTLTLKKIDK